MFNTLKTVIYSNDNLFYTALDKGMVREVKERCRKFMITLINEIAKRLPDNKKIFKDIILLAPEKVLSPDSVFGALPFPGFCESKDKSEEEFRKLKQVDWREDGPWAGEIPTDPVTFWADVGEFQMSGEKIFSNIAGYALACLSLPASNAYVERVFSIVNFVKDKYSNRMLTPMLDALILIRTHLQAVID